MKNPIVPTREDIRRAAHELTTVRDFLRYAVSQFTAAELVFGHGTTRALDEAAFLILATLKLPIEEIDPWLEAKLTAPERELVADVIARRIETRKPASYLVGEAWIGPYSFRVDERVIVPRSFIGELLVGGFDEFIGELGEIRRGLDLCTGSGCLAILMAHAFPGAQIVACDISADALVVAKENVADYGLEEQIRLVRSDLYDGLNGSRFDLIISNPPYVTDEAVAAFPPEYAAEPALAHAGGTDGLDLVHRILKGAGTQLEAGGTFIAEIGQGRDLLESCYPEIPFHWLDTEQSEGEVLLLRKEDLPG
ncbi:MAG: protein-(glutamine-N5) methyltransferase, ribosomal protein L3-specific [Alphaproteobacteria bacterium BRH_c36]|nr:MAG: protein-(glutamine-N5) methyltransferase, ribosomal protein L3-specific [Alphaproteobacteria bacterium BRH_c36]